VRAHQGKPRQAVVKRCLVPPRGRMAVRAVGGCERRSRRRVHRIIGLLPGAQVATGISAVRGSDLQIVIVIDVARRAGNIRVPGRQQESRRAVIKFRAQPAIEEMAPLAVTRGKRRSGARMWWIGGVLPVFQVAGIARRGEPQEHSRGSLLVAFVALHRGMRAEQRKAVLVIAHRLHGNVPTLHRMALRAIRTHLAPVNIRVAVRAVLAHIREHRLYVALRALHFLVHAAKRITRFVVVKLGDRPDRAPPRGSMAILAGNR